MTTHQLAERVAIVADDDAGDQLGVADRRWRHQRRLPSYAKFA
jgi:hypothetical protein